MMAMQRRRKTKNGFNHLYWELNFLHIKVMEAPYTRLCSKKKILTVNGQFPGPALHVHHGDTIYVTVHNKGRYNITIHWYI
jgi:hypothetical protein